MKQKEPVFRIQVSLQKPFVEAYGEKVLLQPGMALTADIIIDRPGLFEWAFDPIFALGRK